MSLRHSHLDRSAVPASSPTRLEALCEGVIEAGWLAVLVAVPLHFNPYSRQTFDPDKTTVLRILVLLMAAAWLVKVVSGGRLAAPRSSADRERGLPPEHGESGELRWWRIPLLLPTAAIVLTLLASAAASIQPALSFTGSYTRGQGVWTQLSYVALFALVLAHLRAARQWRRIIYAVAVTSFAVSSYAVLQRLGLDPVLWTESDVRVGSTMGNPIFLAGFLLFVVFITVHELFGRWRPQQELRSQQLLRSQSGARARGADVPTLAILVYNLVLQAFAVVFAQSRGPVLGLLAGGFVAGLALLLDRRERKSASPRWSWLRRHAWLLLIAVAVGVLLLFAAASRPGTRASRLAQLPHVGRLLAPFNLDTGTARVRVLLWTGGVDLLRDVARGGARRPGSGLDPARPASDDSSTSSASVPRSTAAAAGRLLLGHGPETYRLAYARYNPRETGAWDDPTVMSDRAHNEALDRLVTTGVLGFASWFWWYGALLLTAVTGVVAPAATSRRLYWSLVVGGAIAGAIVPPLLGQPALAFFGVPTGVLAGAVAFLGLVARRSTAERAGPRTPYQTLSIALLATATAHLVEISLGIAVTATSAYLWFFAAALVAVDRRWLALEEPEPDAQRATVLSSAVVAGLLAALVASTLAFAFLGNSNDQSSAIAVLAAGFTGATGIATSALWLPLLCWMAAAALAGSLERRMPSGPTGASVFGATSLAVAGAYLVYHSTRLAGSSRMRAEGSTLPDLLDHISHHATAYAVFLLGWTLLAGAALGIAQWSGRPRVSTSKERWRTAAVVAVAAAALAPAVATVVRRPIVDSLSKNASVFASTGVEDGMVVLRRAASLDSREPVFELERGRALVEAAKRTQSEADRARWLGEARTALETARSLAPLDPDHTANLARLEAVEAELAPDSATRRARLDAAAETYVRTLELRPTWARLIIEYAVVEYRRGRHEEAFDLSDRALELAPNDPVSHQLRADIHRAAAAAARLAGDESSEHDHRRLAAEADARVFDIEKQQLLKAQRRWQEMGGLRSRPGQPSPPG